MRFLVVIVSFLCLAAWADGNLLTAVYTAQAPALDGKPVGGAWEQATWSGNPVYLNDTAISSILNFQVGALWDAEALYIGFKVDFPRSIRAVTTIDGKGDDGLERDDSVEVTLLVPGFSDKLHNNSVAQFKLNFQGQRDDAIHFDFSWNADWDGATRVEGNTGYATFRIPFANFGVTPAIGDRWGANFGAFMVGRDYRAFLWSPVNTGHHHNHEEMGSLVFGAANTPGSRILAVTKELDTVTVSGEYAGTQPATVRLLLLENGNSEQKKKIRDGFQVVDFDDEKQKALKQNVVDLTGPGSWSVSLENLPAGDYKLKTILFDANRRHLNVDVKPFRVDKAIEVELLPYPVRGSADARITVHHLEEKDAVADLVKLQLLEQDGTEVFSTALPYAGKRLSVNLGELENNHTYTLIVTASGDAQSVCQTETLVMKERPVWADTRAGISDTIPAPWTPLAYSRGMIVGNQKELAWDKTLLPSMISSFGYRIVAAPMTIEVAGAQQSESFEGTADFTVTSENHGRSFAVQAASAGKLGDITIHGEVEFDGFSVVELAVVPKAPLTQLTVKIPLGPKASAFMQPLPGAKNRDQSGNIPPAGVGMNPVNSIWLSSPDAGLYFGMESLEHWIAPENMAVQLRPTADGMMLVLNLYLDNDVPFTQERKYLFMLQPAPLHDYTERRWSDGPVVNNLNLGDNVSPLADDVVRRLSPDWGTSGVLQLKLHNYNDLASIAQVNTDHWGANERILTIGENVELLYSQPDRAIVLSTPQGKLRGKSPCDWSADGDHVIEIGWGDSISLRIDGNPAGELPGTGNDFTGQELALGAISSRYRLDGLLLNDLPLLEEPLELRSSPENILSALKKSGAGTLIFFEHWCSAQNGGRSIYEPILKNIVEDVHAAGMKVIFYFGFEIADVPEHQDMLVECKAIVDQGANFYAPARQNTYWVSYGGPYMEYLLYNMERLKREVGIDGVYLDGSLGLAGADNPAFGAGYVDPDGSRKTTVPIRRIREFAQRLHQLFVQDQGVIFAHMPMSPPTMGYVSSAYLGEHLGFLNLPWESVEELIPRETAINLYAGKNTGVPMVLCIQNMWPHLRGVRPRWYQRSSTWADLNRVGINVLLERPMYKYGTIELNKAEMFKDFDADHAVWLPYWELSERLNPSDPELLVSAYVHGRDRAIVTIYNSGNEKIQNGSIDLAAILDCSGKSVHTVPQRKPVLLEGTRIFFEAPAFEGITVIIE